MSKYVTGKPAWLLFHKDSLIPTVAHCECSEESSETVDEQWPGECARQETPAYLQV